ncbi:hypothetical protein CRUP_020506, partial [Coryphaenoides rupestris]
ALLDCNVFESVGTKVFGTDKNQNVFLDCKNTLYRQEELRLPSSAVAMQCSPGKCVTSPGNVQCLEALSNDGRSLGLIETDQLSFSPSRLQTATVIPHALVNEVWQEQTTVRLLKLVDLPLLDGVLQCLNQGSHSSGAHPLAHGNPDLIYSDHHLDRHILQAFRDSHEDEWLHAALDCLGLLPDQAVVELSRAMPSYFPQDADGPQHMEPVNAKLDKALEVLQLCLKLLPPGCREELRRLLTFMSLAADPQAIRLDKEMENRLAVRRSFSRAVVHSKTLSKEQEELMIPGALHKAVSDQLASIVHGKPPDVTATTFCQQVYRGSAHSKDNTDKELRALLSDIHLDPKISDKKKKNLFRQFYQSHPEVFDRYFGDSALSML